MNVARLFTAFALSVLPTTASGQWLELALPNTPRTSDGKPNLSAPAPRLPDGRPDLSGIWQRTRSNILRGVDIPMLPWTKGFVAERLANNGKDNPEGFCLPQGTPEQMLTILPWKVIHTPGVTLILLEQWADYRQIFTDGRALPEIRKPSWLGYSVGRWDGDTFVAETAGLNDVSWLGNDGWPRTEAMRITERFRRINFGSLEVQFTFDDPKAYTRPWSVTGSFQLLPDTEIMEYICENQKWGQR